MKWGIIIGFLLRAVILFSVFHYFVLDRPCVKWVTVHDAGIPGIVTADYSYCADREERR